LDAGEAMKVALYARVSTEDYELAGEKKVKRQDPEAQLIPLRKYCEARGFEVAAEFKESKSGMDDDRPELKEMLRQAELERKSFQAIIVFKTDRLTRKGYTLFEIFKRLKAAKVTFISMEESLDTSSIYSEGIMLILGLVAGWEREGLVQRVRAGVKKAQLHGTKSGRPIGRPNVKVDLVRLERLIILDQKISQRCLADNLGVTRPVLARFLKKEAARNPRVSDYLTRTSKTGDERKEVFSCQNNDVEKGVGAESNGTSENDAGDKPPSDSDVTGEHSPGNGPSGGIL
jgi:DNA invertase Pin-like site-specific DNA recombinase